MTETLETNTEQTVSGKFAMLPNEILGILGKNILTPSGRVEKIDGDDLVWWMFFFTFLYQKKPCYQTRKTISDRFECSEKTVTRRTARLESLGLLDIQKRKGTSSIFTAASVEEFLAKKTNKKVTPKEESNGEDEQQPVTDAPETSAAAAGKPDGVPVVGAPVDDALPIDDNVPLSGPDGENVVEFPRSGRPKLSFKFVSPDDDDLENYSEEPQVDFDKDGQPPNKWKDFDMATTCDFLYDL
ncbi:hypothetical protein [Klebsiella variicola]|uniref:hypothetical protein n=1 Tax=Klebsiella variicola TaxID=244366 RepID=UPI002B055156|nr:hypothetical protein [Klebsiella variicola]HBQ6910708.1 HTH domain-containing protein [Klebsiella pneumoniae]